MNDKNQPNRKNLMDAMKKEPDLSAFGIVRQYERRTEEDQKRFQRDRKELAGQLRMFQLCCAWLSLCGRRKTVNPAVGSSYFLKHCAETWAREYVTNGAFIAAVIHLGIPYKRYPDSPNIAVAISSKRLPPLGPGPQN